MSKLVPNADVVVNGRSRRQIQEQQQMEIARQQAQQPSIKVTHNNYAKPAPVQPIYEYETYEEEYEEEEEELEILEVATPAPKVQTMSAFGKMPSLFNREYLNEVHVVDVP